MHLNPAHPPHAITCGAEAGKSGSLPVEGNPYKHLVFAPLLNRILQIVSFVLVLFTPTLMDGQSALPFTRGVNISDGVDSDTFRHVNFLLYSKNELSNIRSMGCDVVRLPVDLTGISSGEPDFIIEPILLRYLDNLAKSCTELDMYLVVDNDPMRHVDPTMAELPSLSSAWKQVANHLKGKNYKLAYELLNEPANVPDDVWNHIQETLINDIRGIDSEPYVIVGGLQWYSIRALRNLPVFDDAKLIYTFHFYDPMTYTHQGAGWLVPSLKELRGLPFPHMGGDLPPLHDMYLGTWVEDSYNNYLNDASVETMIAKLDVAAAFAQQRGALLFCGEFGVHLPYSDENHRIAWTGLAKDLMEERGIAWTVWDYRGNFGLFHENTQNIFNSDMNVELVEALGLNPPVQVPHSNKQVSEGYIIYDDFPSENTVIERTPGVNYYSTAGLWHGDYCIQWDSPAHYRKLQFDFRPDIDLSSLVSDSCELHISVKSTSTNPVEIRFVDSKASDVDKRWRMGFSIDVTHHNADNNWYELVIPLSAFQERGAMENGQWQMPQGLFDWSSVDHFEIVAERGAIQGSYWFDCIRMCKESGANHPPVLTPIGSRSVPVGQKLQFTVQGSDVDGDTLQYSATGG